MTDLPNKQDKLWAKCPPGAIQQVADSSMVSRAAKPEADLQRRKLLIATSTAAGVAILGGITYLATRQPGRKGTQPPRTAPIANYTLAGINCVEVAELIPAYINNTVDDQETTDKIEKHLELCDKCRRNYENQLKAGAHSVSAVAKWSNCQS